MALHQWTDVNLTLESWQQASGFHNAEYSLEMLFLSTALGIVTSSEGDFERKFSAAGRYKCCCEYIHTDTFDLSEMIVLAET